MSNTAKPETDIAAIDIGIPVHGLQDWNVSDGQETEVELHQMGEKLKERNAGIAQVTL